MAPRGLINPDLSLERRMAAENKVTWVAGIDEAGRGALAGPVYAAAVMISGTGPDEGAEFIERLRGVRDSKLLTAVAREDLFDLITALVPAYGIGQAPVDWIDQHGIISATRQAIALALAQLKPAAEATLMDGPLRLATANLPQWPIVRGDQRSLSIAAASILAKVSRDRHMIELSRHHPDYGFERHKGYGTVEHRAALDRFGPCPEHRRSFAPLRKRLI